MEIFDTGKVKIANRYLILKKIGFGAFGAVYEGFFKVAQDTMTNEMYAVKIVK